MSVSRLRRLRLRRRRHPMFAGCLSLIATVALWGTAVRAHDFERHAFPNEWIEPLVPEDLPKLEHPSYYEAIDKARAEVMSGRYKLALATLHGAGEVDPVQIGLIRAAAQAALGRSDEALATLAQPALAEHPEGRAARARVLADLGRTDEALALVRDLVAAHPDSIDGRFLLGHLNEQVGDVEAARAAYAWFVEDQKFLDKWAGGSDPIFESAHNVTLIGRAIDRYAAITEAYKDNAQLHNTVLNMFVKAYDVIDRTYWPARVAAAEYFVQYDNVAQAMAELAQALEANPNDAAALQLAGQVAAQTFNFDRADAAIAKLREVNAASVGADLLEARNLLRQRLPQDAEAPLRRVLERQPKNIEAMGLLAAAHALQLREDDAMAVLREVDAIDVGHDNASAYFEVAEQLGAMRQYPRAAAMYQIAIDRAPWWTAPRNGLGLLYTQSGDEDLARATLEAARVLDPFNLATTNYLRLLDDLATFDVRETPHFLIYYHAELDPLIPEYFAEYLEEIYPQVTDAFRHEPAVKTMIEVFPTHDGFSVRTTGSPWIGTVGASTGRVIAMVAPRKGKRTMGPYHWAQVLRHEFTHTVTLSATDNRIAHWMTEGLAVLEEHSPLKWDWVPMLYKGVSENSLFTLDDLTWGFVRPRRPTDRQLAYAESFWICKYIEETYGRDALLRMLEEFKQGRAQEQVFPSVLGRSTTQFTEEFFAWARAQVAGWGYDQETTKRYDELRERGEQLIKTRQFDEALAVWQEIQSIRPVDPLPHQRLAGLYLRLEQPERAAEHLVALHRAEIKDNRYAKRAARLYRDLGQLDQALVYARESIYIDAYDADAHELLADLYEQTNKPDLAQREREAASLIKQRPKEE